VFAHACKMGLEGIVSKRVAVVAGTLCVEGALMSAFESGLLVRILERASAILAEARGT